MTQTQTQPDLATQLTEIITRYADQNVPTSPSLFPSLSPPSLFVGPGRPIGRGNFMSLLASMDRAVGQVNECLRNGDTYGAGLWRNSVIELAAEVGGTIEAFLQELEDWRVSPEPLPEPQPPDAPPWRANIEEEVKFLLDNWTVRFLPHNNSLQVELGRIALETDDVEVDLGEFYAIVDLTTAGGRADYLTVGSHTPILDNECGSYFHPHVGSAGDLCAGRGSTQLLMAWQECRLNDYFELARRVLQTYNPGSPFVPLESWGDLNHPCASCGYTYHSGTVIMCPACDREFCEDCNFWCPSCEETRCTSCAEAFECESCGEYVCGGCAIWCDECRRAANICSCCRPECHSCRSPGCSGCLWECECCQECHCRGCMEPDTDLCKDCYEAENRDEESNE